ncbi:monocarboxylate transporter 2-like [Hetaerina americana]|uniref:monocarboxylate transporter 2-like n=1 Tax=Hetaerina americana TaxID=62018 RepID=UPI003A7F4598
MRQHYYPEGGWGWAVVWAGTTSQLLAHGLHLSAGPLCGEAMKRFPASSSYVSATGWLGAMSTAVALFLSPVTIAFCRRKSTRVTAVLGGLVTALGCLFSSFASQFHQLFFSYGAVVGVGVGLTRDTSTLMVSQYFKRRRELVEIFIVAGSGIGLALMSAFIKAAVGAIGWRLGLQAVTGAVFTTFLLGTFYRSASLYHPQRRAILHLKNQRRKVKEKPGGHAAPPFLDFTALKSRTVRILLLSTALAAFGINTPIFYLAHQAEEEGLGADTATQLQACLGIAWALGAAAFGALVVRQSPDCRIARHYLCQVSVFACGVATLALTAVEGRRGYLLFACVYGVFVGGYHYSLKVYTYERVRARHFARAWGFVQCSQAIPIALGVPISGYINVGCGGKAGYYFSSTCILMGSVSLFLIDVHRRNVARQRHVPANNKTQNTCQSSGRIMRRGGVVGGSGGEPEDPQTRQQREQAELLLLERERARRQAQRRRLSFTEDDLDDLRDLEELEELEAAAAARAALLTSQRSFALLDAATAAAVAAGGGSGGSGGLGLTGELTGAGVLVGSELKGGPELTCISEEGIADMDLPDNLLDDLDYIGDCITSCNKVENYLMLSEFENNLIAEMPIILDRKGRRWSLARQGSSVVNANNQLPSLPGNSVPNSGATQTASADASSVLKVEEDEGGGDGKCRAPVVIVGASDVVMGEDVGEDGREEVYSEDGLGTPRERRRRRLSRDVPLFRSNNWRLMSGPKRTITVIDEASV